VNARLASAALTALCCSWGCGDGIPVTPPPDAPAASTTAPAEAELAAGSEDAPAVIDPDAPTSTLEAPLEAWPLHFASDVLATIDDALFVGDQLVVAGRVGDQVVLVRLARAADKTVAVAERVARVAPCERVVLTRLGARAAAMWVSDGHLEALAFDKTLGAATPSRVSGEEGGQLTGAPVVAESEDGLVACAGDSNGPTCFELDRDLGLVGARPLGKKAGDRAVALMPTSDGFVLVLGDCNNDSCSRVDLGAVLLDDHGLAGKRRALPEIQLERGTAFVPEDDGFVLVARRVGAGEHSAWRFAGDGARELDGRFSRVVGGFSWGGRTLLVERSHLIMRKGFPVRGYQIRPLDADAGTRAKPSDRVAREALPEHVAELLPSDADQTFSGHDDTLLFVAPLRKGKLEAAAVRLMP